MSNDVLITPASRKIEFKDSSANVDAKIETDASGNLIITNTGGDISIGDTTSDIFVGDGTNNIDIVFEQDGEIRGTSGVTVTLGQSDSNIRMATDLNLNSNDITNAGSITGASFSDGTISGITFIDEDSFATNSATRVPTQQSIKAYVDTQVAGVVDSAPAALDTLNELAAALGDDANFSTTTTTALGNRLRVDTAAQGLTGTQQANAITNLGITATKAELNYVDGVTSNIQTQLNGKQATGSYLTGNQTITLSGDVSGSGTTSIAVTVADDSHNHIISNVDGLQTALDAKLPLAGGTMTGTLFANAGINLGNTGISGVNALSFNDPGPNEGLSWTGGNTKIYESPDDLTTNTAGNLQFVYGTTRRLTVNSTGINVNGNITVSGTVDGVDIAARNGVLTSTTTTANAALPKTGGAMTGAITTNSTFDGRDVATDGAKLDGIESGATADQTAAQILTAIKTVDGAGSGLDADLLDGISSASFLRSDANDTFTGTLTTGELTIFSNHPVHAGYSGIANTEAWTATTGQYMIISAGTDTYINGDNVYIRAGNNLTTNELKVTTSGTTIGGNTVWHAGNDGAGSGLDADLLDGISSASFLRSDATDTASGALTFTGAATFDQGTNTLVTISSGDTGAAGLVVRGDAQGTGYIEVGQSSLYGGGMFYNGDGSPAFAGGETADHIGFYRNVNGTRTEVFHYSYNSNDVNFNGNITVSGTVDGRDVASDGSKLDGIESGATADQTAAEILTAIKTVDGAGSGLDADLLDGISSGSFLRSDNADTFGSQLTSGNNVAIRFAAANFSDTNDGKIGAGLFSTGLNIVGAQTSAGTGRQVRIWGEVITDGGNKYWHAGNDGSGSGLDADTVDGVQASSIVQLTGTQTITGAKYFQANMNTTSSNPPLQAYSSSGGAIMSFHRANVFAINMGLDSDNVFRIGGWSAGTNRFQMDMSGNLTMAGNVTAYSDIRLKENIKVIPDALSKVQQIRGVTFTRNDTEDLEKLHTGVIAQEVEAVLPEAVSEDNDGIKNIAYGNMVGLLIEAIKEQQKQIDDLKQQINEQKEIK